MAQDQGFPIINQPVVDLDLRVTQAWRQFFVSLWQRTGGGSGSPAVPPGVLQPYAGAVVPDGWVLANGQAISRTLYASLFSAIGTTWGAGDGATTFNVPDLRGRAALGVDGTHALGTHGGAAAVNLAVNQLPAHNHPVVDPGHTHVFTPIPHLHKITDPGHIHAVTDPQHHHASVVAANNVTAGAAAGGVVAGNTADAATGLTIQNHVTNILQTDLTDPLLDPIGTVDAHATGVTTGNTGTGQPVPTQSPYAAVTYIIKT